ncbi:MAG: hypothetical protein LIO94_08420 [Clostridiales bacterium]|nr:hypothetical protein [Clostridiales bacterium]
MKRISRIITLCFLMLAFSALPSVCSHAANPSVVSLSTDTVYKKYDITGDGKADKIKLKMVEGSIEGYSAIKVYVNGSLAGKFKSEYTYYAVQDINLYTLDNGKVFLYISLRGDNSPVLCAFYQYKSGKLKKVVDLYSLFSKYGGLNGYYYAATITVQSGNKLKIEMPVQLYTTGMATITYKCVYKSGTLKLSSKKGTVSVYNSSGGTSLTANKKITAYKKAGSSQKAFTIKAGSNVTIDKCWISGSKLYLRVRYNGKYGWIKGLSYSTSWYSNRPFSNAMYGN